MRSSRRTVSSCNSLFSSLHELVAGYDYWRLCITYMIFLLPRPRQIGMAEAQQQQHAAATCKRKACARARSVVRYFRARSLAHHMAEYGCDKFSQPFAGINMTSNRFNGRLESSARIAKSALRRNTRSMVYKKQLIRNICHIARKFRNKSYSARKK